MAEARTAPCTPWTTEQAVLAWPSVCKLAPPPAPDVVANMIAVAGWLLYERSGRRWPGICSSVAFISDRRCGCPPRQGCGHWWTCNGPSGPAIRVGHSPIVAVTEIELDGVVLDAGAYRIEDGRWIVRTDGDGWAGAELIEVTYTHGIDPPVAGELAARVLAAELLAAGTPGATCQLPRRTQSAARQGVTVAFMDPQEFFGEGLTGVYEVDLFLTSLPKPVGTRRSRVIIPGVGPVVHRRG